MVFCIFLMIPTFAAIHAECEHDDNTFPIINTYSPMNQGLFGMPIQLSAYPSATVLQLPYATLPGARIIMGDAREHIHSITFSFSSIH